MVKQLTDKCVQPLAHMYNELKIIRAVASFKTNFWKNVQVILKSGISKFFKVNCLLNSNQYGFRFKRSTVRKLGVDIVEGFEENEIASVSLYEFSKVFDCEA